VITVASVNQQNDVSGFTNYGKLSVNVGAPGEEILSTVIPEASMYMDGTSMATPHVSGVAALVWSNELDCSNAEIRAALDATAKDKGPAGRDNAFGFGIVQAKAAVDYLTANPCGGGGTCQPKGASCTSDSECCSNRCTGKAGRKTCK